MSRFNYLVLRIKHIHLKHTKKAVCQQQWSRTTCTTCQPYQQTCCLLPKSIIQKLLHAKFKYFKLAYVAVQAELRLTW